MNEMRELSEGNLSGRVCRNPGLILVEIIGDETLVPDSILWVRLFVHEQRHPEESERVCRSVD
jgi:hypothetical protein